VLVPPGQKRVVQVHQLLGQLIQRPPPLRVAIDDQPGRLDRVRRFIGAADVAVQHLGRHRQAGGGQLRQGVVVKAGRRDGGLQRRMGLGPTLVITQETFVLQAQGGLEPAELVALEA